jgi:hypothetical protein
MHTLVRVLDYRSIAAVMLVCWPLGGVCSAATRHWQAGTLVDAGVKRDPFVGGAASGRNPFGLDTATPRPPVMPEVSTYTWADRNRVFQFEPNIGSSIDPLTLGLGQ